MAIPIVGALTGLLGRAVASAASKAVPFAGGVLGRMALSGGTRGAVGRVGLAGYARMKGTPIPPEVVGGLARDFTQLGLSVVNLPSQLRRFSQGLLDSTEALKYFSAPLSASYARLEADRIRRSIVQARELAASTDRLISAQSRLEESLQPINTWWKNLQNNVSAFFTNLAAREMEHANNFWLALERVLGLKTLEQQKREIKAAREAMTPLDIFARDLAGGKYGGRKFPPLPDNNPK